MGFRENAEATVMALVQNNFPEKNEVLEALRSKKAQGQWIQVWLTDLIGEMKITESIPDIVDQLTIDSDYLLESSMYALGKIGDPIACDLIERRYHNETDCFKIYAAGVFEMIHFPKSIELLIKVFRQEDDDDQKILLIGSILDMNSKKGFSSVINAIIQYEEEFEYNPEIAAIQHSAVTHADMLGISFAQRDRWSVDRDIVQKNFEQEMGRMSGAGNQDSANILPFRNPEKKTGRNDLCPCNSGKKYKKCCLPTTEQK